MRGGRPIRTDPFLFRSARQALELEAEADALRAGGFLRGNAPEMKAVHHVRLSKSAPEVTIRVFDPGTAAAPAPALVFVPPQRAVAPDLDPYDNALGHLAESAQLPVVAVEAEPRGRGGLAAGVDACESALEWLTGSARELGIDPRRVAIGGEGFGARVVAELCRVGVLHIRPRIACLLFPGPDVSVDLIGAPPLYLVTASEDPGRNATRGLAVDAVMAAHAHWLVEWPGVPPEPLRWVRVIPELQPLLDAMTSCVGAMLAEDPS